MAEDPGEQRDMWDERQDMVECLSQLRQRYQAEGRSIRQGPDWPIQTVCV
jgi:hypothetical protein